MKYHINDKAWKAIYQNLRQEKGIHTRIEEKLRIFYEAIAHSASKLPAIRTKVAVFIGALAT